LKEPFQPFFASCGKKNLCANILERQRNVYIPHGIGSNYESNRLSYKWLQKDKGDTK